MASKEKSAGAWPDVPPSLHHESFEMSELNKEQLRPYADTAPEVTPYLGLRSRLSQIWFNRWTVLLLLVLVRVLIGLASLNDQIGDAKTKALSACTKVEDIGSAMASMPHYLSVGVNSLAADGISKSVHAMVEVLMMILTGVEQLILFIINMYVGTYACLIAAFIHGGLDVSIGAVEGTTNFINDNIGKITDEISSDIKGIQDAINKAFAAASGVANAFGQNVSPPTIDITGHLDDLKNIKVDDTEFVKDLVQLNTTIPTFDQVENFTKEALSVPFDLVKNALNNSFAGYAFDKTVFPVAEKKGLSFCSNNSFLNDFFQSLYEIAAKAKIAFIVVLVILAIGAIFVMSWLEIRRWRRQRRHAYVFSKDGYDPMDVVYVASRPVSATFGIKLVSRFSGKRQIWARWAWAYATSLPALFVLSLAVAGFFSCLCQAILLRSLQQEAPALASQVGDFAGEVVGTLQDVSTTWANDANGVVTNFNTDINNDLFGYVQNATAAVNNTLNTFEEEIEKAITLVFNGTVLENTVRNVVRCLIGIKIDTVEAGLTWVHDHAHVSFPLFPNDTFSEGAADSIHGDSELTSFLATPASVTTDEISGAVDHVITALRNSIIQEALISTMLLLVYVVVVLVGVLRSAVGMVGRDKTRGEGGQRYVTGTEEPMDSNAGGYAGGYYRSAPSPGVTQRGGAPGIGQWQLG
ncbi:plasma membrane fusion protein PRM1 [Coniochaeta ligniaria NRRL 30616]|uniref:Plasma membrane fusion protein PRM1 n=1 Tax=Coniochaeta ligniaria NRRL 30616 TaxID=1408157 RepID=A0A1J7IKH0_9PEZI|nr:plasma membrane fusion protein PRM1 [Coniochaeta ligniaria NRRL 30616]